MSSPWHEHTYDCGHSQTVHEDWDLKDYCSKECYQDSPDYPWSEHTFQCGHTKTVHKDWDLQDYCSRECYREAEWTEIDLECGHSISVRKEWDKFPKICKNCCHAYPDREDTCKICARTFRISSFVMMKANKDGWKIPDICRDCRNSIKNGMPQIILCMFCNESIDWSPYCQLMVQHQGWTEPTRCRDCKENLKYYIRGALSGFNDAGYTEIEDDRINVYNRNGNYIGIIEIKHKFSEGKVGVATPINGERSSTYITERAFEGKKAETFSKDGEVTYTELKSQLGIKSEVAIRYKRERNSVKIISKESENKENHCNTKIEKMS